MQRKIIAAIVTAVCCISGTTNATEVNMNPGMWEWTAEMDIPNMPKNMSTSVSRKCLTKDDLVPDQNKKDQKCDIKDLNTSKDSVTWSMTCNTPQGSVDSTGKMFYHGDTANGEVKVQAQGMMMSSKMSGKRVGPCKQGE